MSSSNWQLLAKNHLGNRAWPDVNRAWAAAAIGFDPLQAQDLSGVLEPILRPGFDARENVSVFNFPGRQQAAFMDAASAVIKAAYILRGAGNCLIGGQPTWAAIDAYHFSFVSARALLGILGVHLVHISDTFAVLDVFPEGETDRARSRFRRQYANFPEPSCLIFRSRSSVIEQRAIWTILVRMLRVTTFDLDIQNEINRIIDLSEGFAAARNEVIYRNSTWIYEEDYLAPGIPDVIEDDPFALSGADSFFDERDSSFAFAMLMLRVLRKLIEAIETASGSDIIPTSYGRCFRRFAGFNTSTLHDVFSSIYKKESYGHAF